MFLRNSCLGTFKADVEKNSYINNHVQSRPMKNMNISNLTRRKRFYEMVCTKSWKILKKQDEFSLATREGLRFSLVFDLRNTDFES